MRLYQKHFKRPLDIILSGIALVVLSPTMLLVGLTILLEDGKPTLFRQERVGREGKPFTVLKFRSMPANTGNVPSAEARQVHITRVGAVTRRLNIDELPQLVNILRGDMSIVGPRPALAKQEKLCRMRQESGALTCTPGLTGLAQVNSYDDMPDEKKAAWDAKYAGSISLMGDVSIILRTFAYLLKPPPVY